MLLSQLNALASPSPQPRSPRRLLVVTPNFAPVSAVDYQRIRMALPQLEAEGWEVEVLTVHPKHIEHGQDSYLLQTLPSQLKVHRVKALPQHWTRPWGLGNLGWRALPFLAAEGDRLMQQQPFDLVFFSTTVFPSLLLGPRWHRKFGVPYVIDFQDPWRVAPQQQRQRAKQRPGGRVKYAMDKALARCLEPHVVKQAAQIIAVSPDYLNQLQKHYPRLSPERCQVVTFGAPEQDFQLLSQLSIQQQIFDPKDGDRHWVYVGRGGDDLRPAVQRLFQVIAGDRKRYPQRWQRLKLHFVGTSYAPSHLAQPSFLDLAKQFELTDIVQESPQRIPYFEALQVLVQSDAIMLLGSKDLSYSPSKVYPCLLAQKPILAILAPNSPVADLIQAAQPGALIDPNPTRVEFSPNHGATTTHPGPDLQLHNRLIQLLTAAPPDPQRVEQALYPYLPNQLNQQLIAVFEQALSL